MKTGNIPSEWIHINGGVPQGTVVGPRAFVQMINDLATVVNHYKYVDDTTLVEQCSFSDKQPVNNMQVACQQAADWARQNKMNFNASKTKLMDINFSKRSESLPDITLCGEVVKKVPSTKLLGVYLSNDLKWDCHIEKIHEKTAKRFYQLCILKRAGVATLSLSRTVAYLL